MKQKLMTMSFVGWAVAILAIQLFQGLSSAAHLAKVCGQ
jgi:hypothetical protein